jgi:hypothetical protein
MNLLTNEGRQNGLEEGELIEVMQYVRSWWALPLPYGTNNPHFPRVLQREWCLHFQCHVDNTGHCPGALCDRYVKFLPVFVTALACLHQWLDIPFRTRVFGPDLALLSSNPL